MPFGMGVTVSEQIGRFLEDYPVHFLVRCVSRDGVRENASLGTFQGDFLR